MSNAQADMSEVEAFQRELDPAALTAMLLPLAGPAIKTSLQAIFLATSPYPNETVANSPQNEKGRWYERGYGQRWYVKGGQSGAAVFTTRQRVNFGERAGVIHGDPTSEQLNLRWQIGEPIISGDQIAAALENLASYAIYVQGQREDQADVMKEIGWTSIDTGIEDSAGAVDEILDVFNGQAVELLAHD